MIKLLNEKRENGELIFLRPKMITVESENKFGLEPGEYLGYEFEERKEKKKEGEQ